VNDFASRAESIGWPEHAAEQRARDQFGQLGVLDLLAEWIAGVQGRYPAAAITRARVIVFAADHGVAVADVSRHGLGYADQIASEIEAGDAAVTRLAQGSGAGVRVVRRPPSARIDRTDAMTAEEVTASIRAGVEAADDEIDSGADLLIMGGVGAAATTSAATLISVITAVEPVKVVGRGSGIDDDAWMRKATAVRDARYRAWPHRNEPVELLRVAGGSDIAAMAGFAFQAALRRTPVLLDGVVATAAATVAATAQPRVTRWWRAAQLTPEPAHTRALALLGMSAVLDLGVNASDGSGGLLALPIVHAALRLHGTTSSAHV
jgi:nicotinate-nucleotide--dimethylbenzimidazole phosphoribosyltransferase